MLFLLTAFAGSPTYHTGNIRFVLPAKTTEDLRKWVRYAAKKKHRTLSWVEVGAPPVSVLPATKGGPRFAKMSRVALIAFLIGLSKEPDHPMERDFLLQDENRLLKPVSLWLDVDGTVAVAVGTRPPLLSRGSWARLAHDHGLRLPPDEERTRFAPRVLGGLQQALDMIEPALVGQLADLDFVRREEPDVELPHGGPMNPAGLYTGDGRIALFDSAVRPSSYVVGAVDKPFHAVTYMFLHEIAHAIADAERRSLRQRWLDQRDTFDEHKAAGASRANLMAERKSLDALRADIEALPSAGRLATRFVEDIDGIENAPTPYGRTKTPEAFAEAFALFYTDPAALARASPKAFAWFRASGHLPKNAAPP